MDSVNQRMKSILSILDKSAISNGRSRKSCGGVHGRGRRSPSRDRGSTNKSGHRRTDRRASFPKLRVSLTGRNTAKTSESKEVWNTAAEICQSPPMPTNKQSSVASTVAMSEDEDYAVSVSASNSSTQPLDPFLGSSLPSRERHESLPCGMQELLEHARNAGQMSCSTRNMNRSSADAPPPRHKMTIQDAKMMPDYYEKPIEYRPCPAISRRASAPLLSAEPWADGTLLAPGLTCSSTMSEDNNGDDIGSWYDTSVENEQEDVGLHISRHALGQPL